MRAFFLSSFFANALFLYVTVELYCDCVLDSTLLIVILRINVFLYRFKYLIYTFKMYDASCLFYSILVFSVD